MPFDAQDVLNIAEEMQEPWKQVSMRYEPMRFSAVLPLSDPTAAKRDLARGMKSPPLRAPVEGMAGDTTASAKT